MFTGPGGGRGEAAFSFGDPGKVKNLLSPCSDIEYSPQPNTPFSHLSLYPTVTDGKFALLYRKALRVCF